MSAAAQVYQVRTAAQRQFIPMTWAWHWLEDVAKVGILRAVADMNLQDARHWAVMPWESLPAGARDAVHGWIIRNVSGR